MEHLDIWDKNQAYRCFLMSAVGVSLKHCANKHLIDSTLDSLYNMTNHKSCAGNYYNCVGVYFFHSLLPS